MSLDEKSKIVVDPRQYVYQIHGIPKGGKTTFVNAVCKGEVFFIDLENGLKHLSVYKEPAKTWPGFCNIVRELLRKQNPKFKYVAIDGTYTLVTLAANHVCQQLTTQKTKVSHVSDLAQGKGYKVLQDQIMAPITALAQSEKYGLWLIGHTKIVTQRTAAGNKEYARSTVIQSIEALLNQFVDLTVYLDYDDLDKRVLWCTSSSWHSAGGRLIMPEKIPMTFKENAKDNFAAFLNCKKSAELFNKYLLQAIENLQKGGELTI